MRRWLLMLAVVTMSDEAMAASPALHVPKFFSLESARKLPQTVPLNRKPPVTFFPLAKAIVQRQAKAATAENPEFPPVSAASGNSSHAMSAEQAQQILSIYQTSN